MKSFFSIVLVFSLFLMACNGSKEKANTNLTPDYEEFTASDSTYENPETDNEQTDLTSSENQNKNIQTYNLSTSNLNQYLASDEQTVLFSFKTKNGKTLSLLTDADKNYLVYRYGTPSKIELQFPKNIDNSSWQKFYVESYKSNAVFLMHIQFEITGYKYNVYYNKFNKIPKDNKIGVQVTTIKGKKIDIRGDINTIHGDINYFRKSDKVRKIPLN